MSGAKVGADRGRRSPSSLGAAIAGDLYLQSAEVGGGLFCQSTEGHRAEVGGKVWMSDAKVGGSAKFLGAAIAGDLYLQSAEVGGSLLCHSTEGHRAEVGGKVWMDGVKVGSNVEFLGAAITGDLFLRNAEVQGDLYCVEYASHLPKVDGHVVLAGARVRGTAELDGEALAVGDNDLRHAEVTTLVLRGKFPEKIKTEGFRFQRLDLPGDDYLAFLAASEPFHMGTYCFMEAWLRERGEDRMADKVYRAMSPRDRTIGLGWIAQAGDWFLDVTIGYGTQSHRLFVYLVLAIVISLWHLPSTRRRRACGRLDRLRGRRAAVPDAAADPPGPEGMDVAPVHLAVVADRTCPWSRSSRPMTGGRPPTRSRSVVGPCTDG